MKTILYGLILFASANRVMADYTLNLKDEDLFFSALTWQESKGKASAVGDKHLAHKAYGTLQIRQPYLDDVNRIAGKDVMRVWGKSKLTLTDIKDPEKARWAAKVYLSYYGRYYTKKTGLLPNEEVYARIHNGGPMGWKDRHTVSYWGYVSRWMEEMPWRA